MDYKRFKKISSSDSRIEWVEDENGTMVECDWEDLEELMDRCERLERDVKFWEKLYKDLVVFLEDLKTKIKDWMYA